VLTPSPSFVMKEITLLCVVIFASNYVAHGLDRISVHPTKNWFLDSRGRVRFFHGVNAVNKKPPWYPEYFTEDTRLEDLKSFGMNIVRLGSMWSGVEPEEGKHNATYMAILDDIVQRLADNGIYTMLDMHQDVLTGKHGITYDGIPRWLVDKYPAPENPYPWPLTEPIYTWEIKYFSQAVSYWFELFYKNYKGSIFNWMDFWGYLAARYKDKPEVIGYNLINEPWVGDYLSDPSLLLPGNAGRRNLQPIYDQVNARIRNVDPNGIIFYEPVFHGQAFDGEATGSGFDHVPGGRKYRDVSAYSFHMYCWALEFAPSDASDLVKRQAVKFCNDNLLPKMLNSTRSNLERTGGGAILTEFGICKTWENRIDVECNTFLDLCDEYLMSWVDWDYSDLLWYDKEDVLRKAKAVDYVRTYARAVAGEPVSMLYDRRTHHFRFIYTVNPSIQAPTEIFVPSMHHPNGCAVSIDNEEASYELLENGTVLNVIYSGTQSVDITVIVNPL